MSATGEYKNGELEQTALLQNLSHAVEQNPAAFGKDASLAVGIGTTGAPTWFYLELSSTGPGRGVTQSWVPEETDAALFMPRGDGECLIAGDSGLLKAAFQHFLGGRDPLSLRLAMMGAK